MDPTIQEILKDSVELVQEVGPILEKQAHLQEKAEEVTDRLIENNYIPITKRAFYIQKLSDPDMVLHELEKLASRLGPDSLAEPAEDRMSPSNSDDQLLNWIING